MINSSLTEIPSLLRKARKAFAKEDFAEAEMLYETVMQDKSMQAQLDLKARYAFCAEKNNHLIKAVSLYKEIATLYLESGERGAAEAMVIKINTLLTQTQNAEKDEAVFEESNQARQELDIAGQLAHGHEPTLNLTTYLGHTEDHPEEETEALPVQPKATFEASDEPLEKVVFGGAPQPGKRKVIHHQPAAPTQENATETHTKPDNKPKVINEPQDMDATLDLSSFIERGIQERDRAENMKKTAVDSFEEATSNITKEISLLDLEPDESQPSNTPYRDPFEIDELTTLNLSTFIEHKLHENDEVHAVESDFLKDNAKPTLKNTVDVELIAFDDKKQATFAKKEVATADLTQSIEDLQQSQHSTAAKPAIANEHAQPNNIKATTPVETKQPSEQEILENIEEEPCEATQILHADDIRAMMHSTQPTAEKDVQAYPAEDEMSALSFDDDHESTHALDAIMNETMPNHQEEPAVVELELISIGETTPTKFNSNESTQDLTEEIEAIRQGKAHLNP